MSEDPFTNLDNVPAIPDTCGFIKELYSSPNLSLAYVFLDGKAKKHKHNIMEEVYFVTKGSGFLTISDKKYSIKKGDTIAIPKNTYHFLETHESSLEVLVITHPKFDVNDVILSEE